MLREGSSGAVQIWLMNGNGPRASMRVGNLPASSAIVGNGDYDGDGHADLLSRDDSTGGLSMLLLVDGRVVGGGEVVPALSLDWEAAGTGDFDLDGRDDVLLRNLRKGHLEVWLMNGPEVLQQIALRGGLSKGWQLAAVADFDADGDADLLWYHAAKGRAAVSLLDPDLRIRKNLKLFKNKSKDDADVVAAGDADGDALPDVVVRERATGALQIWFTSLKKGKPKAQNASSLGHAAFLAEGGLAGFEVQAGGDFDGDDRMDLVLRNQTSGDLRVWYLDDDVVGDEVRVTDPGASWVFEGVGSESPSTHR
jgi:hypothetical protein